MSTTDGRNFASAATTTEARQRRIRHVLEGYGVLTHDNLRELCHAEGWEVPFDVVLSRAVRRGQVKQLSDELFEPGETE